MKIPWKLSATRLMIELNVLWGSYVPQIAKFVKILLTRLISGSSFCREKLINHMVCKILRTNQPSSFEYKKKKQKKVQRRSFLVWSNFLRWQYCHCGSVIQPSDKHNHKIWTFVVVFFLGCLVNFSLEVNKEVIQKEKKTVLWWMLESCHFAQFWEEGKIGKYPTSWWKGVSRFSPWLGFFFFFFSIKVSLASFLVITKEVLTQVFSFFFKIKSLPWT